MGAASVARSEAVPGRDPSTLRQHRHPDEILREQRADPVDQFVAGGGPGFAGRPSAELVAHPGGARREDRQVGAALALHLELTALDRLADLVVADCRARRRRFARGMRLDLLGAPGFVLTRGGCVVAVTVDDHGNAPSFAFASLAARASPPPRQASV